MSNQATYRYAKDLGGLELLQARYQSQTFSRHVHEGFCIGLIESGAQGFYRSGESHLAPQDSIIFVNADQVHDGYTASENGWSYQAMYPLPEQLAEVASEFQGAANDIPWFVDSVVSDPVMAKKLRGLFTVLHHSENLLERETYYLSTMAELISRHGKRSKNLLKLHQQPRAVQRVRDYLDDCFAENISMQQLADLVQLSPFYLARLFHRHVGLPPHAYQVQRRIHKAKQLIHHGIKLSDVALDCGFTDQSHLSRHFKKAFGIAPGAYQKMANH